MKRAILALAALASLSACSQLDHPVSAGDVAAKAEATIDKVQGRYDQVKSFLSLLEPFLPASRVDQIHAIEKRIDAALDLARKATTAADQASHLKAAQLAASELDAAAAAPAAP